MGYQEDDRYETEERNYQMAHWAEQNGWIHEDDLEEKVEALEAAEEMKYNLKKAQNRLASYLYALMDENACRGCTSHTREQMMAWALAELCEGLGLNYREEQFTEFFKKSA